MISFRYFIENFGPEEVKDINSTLSKLPPSHANLVKNFKWKFHGGNTLNGDDQHVGYIDDKKKEIAIAAPLNYGREHTILHEIAHRVWDKLVPPQLKAVWYKISQQLTDKQKNNLSLQQNPEELFAMAYAQHYVTTKLVKFDNPLWDKFIEELPQ